MFVPHHAYRKMAIQESPTVEGKETMAKFIRKGKVGDHKTLITGNLLKRFDKWIESNTKGTDLPKFNN